MKPKTLYINTDQQRLKETDLKDISDEHLVDLCLTNDRPAWNEFFRRFIPTIKAGIQDKLYDSGYYDLVHGEDILWNIHENIVEKLYCGNILRSKPSDVRPWLRTIAQNQTIDWLKEQGRIKRLPKKQTEGSTISLSAPKAGMDGITVEDTIPDKSKIKDDPADEVEKTLAGMDEIDGIKMRWTLRLSIILQLPLSEEEIEEISEFSGFNVGGLKDRLSKMILEAEKSEEKRKEALSKAVLRWHEIIRKQAIVEEKSGDLSPENQLKVEELNHEIQKKSEEREKLLKRGDNLSRPSNGSMAEIVGLSENQVNQVSNLLIRARNILKENI